MPHVRIFGHGIELTFNLKTQLTATKPKNPPSVIEGGSSISGKIMCWYAILRQNTLNVHVESHVHQQRNGK